jgi:hypothetical protein
VVRALAPKGRNLMAFLSLSTERRPLIGLLALATCLACSSDENPAGTGGSGGRPLDAGPIGPPATTDWTMLGYDQASTYWNRGETKITKETVGSLEWAWEFDSGGNVNGAPIVVGNRVFVLSGGGTFALDANSGAKLWGREGLDGGIAGFPSPTYEEGTLYVGANGKVLYALNPLDGSTKWERIVDDYFATVIFASPILT